jgi:hypothetical protein
MAFDFKIGEIKWDRLKFWAKSGAAKPEQPKMTPAEEAWDLLKTGSTRWRSRSSCAS